MSHISDCIKKYDVDHQDLANISLTFGILNFLLTWHCSYTEFKKGANKLTVQINLFTTLI